MKKPKPINFDLTTLLTAAGDAGASLPALTIMARDVTGDVSLKEDDVRAELSKLIARGLVKNDGGRWKIR